MLLPPLTSEARAAEGGLQGMGSIGQSLPDGGSQRTCVDQLAHLIEEGVHLIAGGRCAASVDAAQGSLDLGEQAVGLIPGQRSALKQKHHLANESFRPVLRRGELRLICAYVHEAVRGPGISFEVKSAGHPILHDSSGIAE